MAREHTRLMKYSVCTPTIVPPTQSKGLSIPIEPVETQEYDMGVSIDLEIEELRKDLKLSTQGEGTLTTSTSSLAFNSESVGASSVPSCPSTTATTTGMTMIYCEFLKSLVDSQRDNSRLFVIEIEMATLYGKI